MVSGMETFKKALSVQEREKLPISLITEADRPQLKQALPSIFGPTVAEDAFKSIDAWLNQKRLASEGKISEKELPYQLEYHALRDSNGKILAIDGIYTVETSAPGFGAKGSWIVARGGWGGVIAEERRKGLMTRMHDYEIQKAKEKGASIWLVETSNLSLWRDMVEVQEKKWGMKNNANVEDYYGKGIDMRCLYANLENISGEKGAANAIETYDASKLEWLKPVFGEKKFAWLSEVVKKAAYVKEIPSDVFRSLLEATPYIIEEGGKPIGFALLSSYSWDGEPAKAPRATFVAAEEGKEGAVATAIAHKAKELGMRMLVVEMPKDENKRLENAFEGLDFTSSQTIKGLYGPYDGQLVDQLILARDIRGLGEPILH
jgi:hypothetical protein